MIKLKRECLVKCDLGSVAGGSFFVEAKRNKKLYLKVDEGFDPIVAISLTFDGGYIHAGPPELFSEKVKVYVVDVQRIEGRW